MKLVAQTRLALLPFSLTALRAQVCYLQGVLDKDIGIVEALARTKTEEVLRSRTVHTILYYKWMTYARRQFIIQLVIYLIFIAFFFFVHLSFV